MPHEWKESHACTTLYAAMQSERTLDQKTIPQFSRRL
jgi:hypothetical protein